MNKGQHIFIITGRKNISLWLILIFTVSMLCMLVLQNKYYTDTFGEQDLKKFERTLNAKEDQLNKLLDEISDTSRNSGPLEYLNASSDKFIRMSEDHGISVYYFKDNRILYWSDHTVKLRPRWNPRYNQPLYFTSNSMYITANRELQDGKILGLIRIKTEYPYENEYLKSGFQKDFKLSPETAISPEPTGGYSDINNTDGDYIFSLELSNILKKNSLNITFATLCWMLAIISLFCFLAIRIDAMKTFALRTKWLITGLTVLFVVAVSTLYFEFPRILFESRFFQPDVFASIRFASLGHLYIYMLLILMITLLLYWFFYGKGRLSDATRTVFSVLLITMASFWFIFFHLICSSLVTDSTISFEFYKLDTLSVFTFIGLIILIMASLVLGLLVDKAIIILGRPLKLNDYLILVPIVLAIQIPFLFTNVMRMELMTPVFFLLILGAHIYLRANRSKIRYSRFFLLLIFYAMFLTSDLQKHTSQKQTSQMEIELAKLASEHDAVAEMLFPELTELIKGDSLLSNRLSYQVIDSDSLTAYIRRKYFNGYWTKYDMGATPCRSNDLLYESYPCYPFYDQLIENEGILVEGSNFYFLNNLNGKISYLGVIPYYHFGDEIKLFLELDSKIVSEELGYPSLLLSKNEEDARISISYAKYNKGKLITSDGIYNYRRNVDSYTSRENTFEEITADGYNHSRSFSD